MKKIFILLVVIFLIAIVWWEEKLVSKSINLVYAKCLEIQTISSNKDNINTSEILHKVDNLYEIWTDYENDLCFVVNHKDIEDIGLELSRLRALASVNQIEDFKNSLALIIFYTEVYNHIMGLSLQNIF